MKLPISKKQLLLIVVAFIQIMLFLGYYLDTKENNTRLAETKKTYNRIVDFKYLSWPHQQVKRDQSVNRQFDHVQNHAQYTSSSNTVDGCKNLCDVTKDCHNFYYYSGLPHLCVMGKANSFVSTSANTKYDDLTRAEPFLHEFQPVTWTKSRK